MILVCVRLLCGGGKISMCSLALHTAEQIGGIVRSHNMRGQPGERGELQTARHRADCWIRIDPSPWHAGRPVDTEDCLYDKPVFPVYYV